MFAVSQYFDGMPYTDWNTTTDTLEQELKMASWKSKGTPGMCLAWECISLDGVEKPTQYKCIEGRVPLMNGSMGRTERLVDILEGVCVYAPTTRRSLGLHDRWRCMYDASW